MSAYQRPTEPFPTGDKIPLEAERDKEFPAVENMSEVATCKLYEGHTRKDRAERA